MRPTVSVHPNTDRDAGALDLVRWIAVSFPCSAATTRERLAATARVRHFAARATIATQGDPPSLGLILEGQLVGRRTSADGRQIMPRLVGPGRLTGMFSVADLPAVSDSLGVTSSTVAFWTRAEVHALLVSDAGFAADLLNHTLRMYSELISTVDRLFYQDARRRVARVLVAYEDLAFGPEPKVTRADLASLVGTSREMTARVLRRLERDGLLERGGKGLRLLDRTGLRNLAAGGGDDEATVQRSA